MAARRGFDRHFELAIDVGVIKHRLRVDADVVVDDELEPREPYAIVRNLREVERELRVAHVHHDLQADIGHHAAMHFLDLGLDQSIINPPFVAFRARHRDLMAFLEDVGRIATTHHGRNAKLSGNNRCVARATTAVGHDGRSAFHHGLPVRIGHVGDQHVAGLHLIHLGDVAHHAYRTRADLLADRPTGDQHLTRRLQAVAKLYVALHLLRLHGFRARLQDIDLAVDTVAAPFNIHGTLVVLFDDDRIAREFDDLVIGERVTIALGDRHIHRANGAPLGAFGIELHFDQLGANATADNREKTRGERRLEDKELIRIDRALYDRFAQSVG